MGFNILYWKLLWLNSLQVHRGRGQSMCVGRARDQGLSVADTFLAVFDFSSQSSAPGQLSSLTLTSKTRYASFHAISLMSTAPPNVEKVRILRAGGDGRGEGCGTTRKIASVRPTSQNPHPTKDENLRISETYLWLDQKFNILFKTWPLNQYPISDCLIICSPVHTNVKDNVLYVPFFK